MARPSVRTDQLILDDMMAIKRLFGSAPNALDCLGLQHAIKLVDMSRALRWESLAPETRDVIEKAWIKWKLTYLKDDAPATFILDPNAS